jgi:GNAT superfamily N-acetyltransferase
MTTIRPARVDDLPALQHVEVAAGRCFIEVGMPEVAGDEALPLEELDRHRRAGLAWVAVDADDRPVAYLVAEVLDGALHVEQVSVHPSHAGQQIGRALLEHAAAEAAARGLGRLTLTTFEQVPWNAPYYRRCGFAVLDEAEWAPGLRAVREREAAHGLDRWPRVCMAKDVETGL